VVVPEIAHIAVTAPTDYIRQIYAVVRRGRTQSAFHGYCARACPTVVAAVAVLSYILVFRFLTVARLTGVEIMVSGNMIVVGILMRRLVKLLSQAHTAGLVIDILDTWLKFESHIEWSVKDVGARHSGSVCAASSHCRTCHFVECYVGTRLLVTSAWR
jgi:hypothetical protein